MALSRWYGVDVQLANEGLRGCLIVASYDNATLSTVPGNLAFVLGVSYKFTENGVRIDGEGCAV